MARKKETNDRARKIRKLRKKEKETKKEERNGQRKDNKLRPVAGSLTPNLEAKTALILERDN
jgi:hypothetical protein